MGRAEIAAAMLACASAGCAEQRVDGVFTTAEWSVVEGLSPLPAVPPDPTNAVADDRRAARLGQMLFFDADYSGAIVVGDDGTNGGLGAVGETGRVSCASCHDPDAHFHDERSVPNSTSLGVDWTDRNSPTVIDSAFYEWFYWDGHADTLWGQALGPVESGVEMAGDRLRIAHMMFEDYRDLYDEIFDPDLDPALADPTRFPPEGGPGSAAWDSMAVEDRAAANRIYANFGKAIAAYERLLVARDAPFDRYVAGDRGAISAAAKRGLRLFIGRAACVDCHEGPFFTDNEFHNVGVAQREPGSLDEGRAAGIPALLDNPFNAAGAFSDDPVGGAARLEALASGPELVGAFRTKSLREVARTGPYMHDGSLATLRDVVEHYDEGGAESGFAGELDSAIRPLNLSARDIDDLVAFLETLSGEPLPPELLEDTSRP